MRPQFIFCGLLLMLICAYLDNMRGPLLPAVSHALSLRYGLSSWFYAAGNLASIFWVVALIPLSHRLGDRKMAAGACVLGVVCAGLCLGVKGFGTLVLLATFWGGAVATISSVSNLLVLKGTDEKKRSRYFCGLHMMYGFGSLAAPLLTGYIVQSGYSWHAPLLFCLPVFAALGLYFVLLFPRGQAADAVERRPFHLDGVQWLAILTFSFYVGAEVMVSAWMVTYLVELRGLPLAEASIYLSGFFLVMGTTRMLCFLTLPPALERLVLVGSLVLCGVFFALGHLGHLWGFPLAGMLGPFFPILLARVTRAFPADSHNLTLAILAGLQLTLVVCHVVMGAATDRLGIQSAYLFSLPLLVATLGAFWLYERSLSYPRRLAATPVASESH